MMLVDRQGYLPSSQLLFCRCLYQYRYNKKRASFLVTHNGDDGVTSARRCCWLLSATVAGLVVALLHREHV